MCKKTKIVSLISAKSANSYLYENKRVKNARAGLEKREPQNEGISVDVYENKGPLKSILGFL